MTSQNQVFLVMLQLRGPYTRGYLNQRMKALIRKAFNGMEQEIGIETIAMMIHLLSHLTEEQRNALICPTSPTKDPPKLALHT